MPNTLHIREAIRVMEDVRDNSRPFDMGDWVGNHETPTDCGTAACFAGWLTRDEFFSRQGFVLLTRGWGVRFHDWGDERAIAELLGCDIVTAQNLIYSDNYSAQSADITPQMVIDRLTALLPDDEKGVEQ